MAIIRAFTALSASLPARNDAGTPMQPAFSPDEGEGIVHGRPLIVIPTIGGAEGGGMLIPTLLWRVVWRRCRSRRG